MEKVKGVCIKEYQDEDDLQDFEDGKIEANEIGVYKPGDTGWIYTEFYDKDYWKPIEDAIHSPNN